MGLARSAAKAVFVVGDWFLTTPPGPRILIYHQVGSNLGRQMEVSVEDFEAQMGWLADNREVVGLDEAVERWEDDDSHELVVLTFDDGYKDTLTTAFPILQGFGFPFLLYLATEAIDGGPPRGIPDTAAPLDWDEVGEMLGSGLLTVGAHTHSHPDMRGLSEGEVRAELETSDELIRRRLGLTARHFAYPYGYWSETAHPSVAARYYTATLGGSPRPLAMPDLHQIHRYPVQLSDSFRFFPARLKGGLMMEERVRRSLKGYEGP
jgi:peptidoglycan/xylan/chitin deacetylase (PgdA/CDA1 family)